MKTAVEMAASGATPRQVYTWTERGWLRAHQDGRVGSGRSYTYDDTEYQVCERMARLTAGGIAARFAAEIARTTLYFHETAPGVFVLVMDCQPGQRYALSVSLSGDGAAACHGQ